jgi:hypothetical protein
VIEFAVDARAGFSALACGWVDRSEMDALLAADEFETERLLDRVATSLDRVELEGRLRRVGRVVSRDGD